MTIDQEINIGLCEQQDPLKANSNHLEDCKENSVSIEEGKFTLIEKLRLVKQAKARKESKRQRETNDTLNKNWYSPSNITEMTKKTRRDGSDPVYWKDGKNAFDYVGLNYFGEDVIEEMKQRTEMLEKMTDEEKHEWASRDKMPKKKYAIMLGYSGTDYNGMQLNAGVKTIEGEIIKAMSRSDCVHNLNSYNPAKISFMRAARTDRGVSAVGQLVSAKLSAHSDLKERLNSKLPETIRVWNVVPTSKSFHAKNATMSRVYEYVMPTFVFSKSVKNEIWDSEDIFREKLKAIKQKHPILFAGRLPKELSAEETQELEQLQPFPPHIVDEFSSDEIAQLRRFRVSKETLASFQEALSLYVGTHNFHNYTVGKTFAEKNSIRTMFSCTASEPFYIDQVTHAVTSDDNSSSSCEYISVTLHGASFMLHQIRKMMTMAILYSRHSLNEQVMRDSMSASKLSIPKAPPTGLFLVECRCSDYNKRNPEQTIDFAEFSKEITDFKKRFIYSDMFSKDAKENIYASWISCIDKNANDIYHYVNKSKIVDKELQPLHLRPVYLEFIYRKRLEKFKNAKKELDSEDETDEE